MDSINPTQPQGDDPIAGALAQVKEWKESGDTEKAISGCKEILAASPDHAEAKQLLDELEKPASAPAETPAPEAPAMEEAPAEEGSFKVEAPTEEAPAEETVPEVPAEEEKPEEETPEAPEVPTGAPALTEEAPKEEETPVEEGKPTEEAPKEGEGEEANWCRQPGFDRRRRKTNSLRQVQQVIFLPL